MHPADELQAVREEIRRLRAREQDLRETLIDGEDRVGQRWHALVTSRVVDRIDADALPLSIRADPRYQARSTVVTLRPRPGAVPVQEGIGDISRLLHIRTGNSAGPSAAPPPAGR